MQEHSHDHSHGTPEPKTPEEELQETARQMMFFEHVLKCSTYRKARLEVLMARRIAKTWAPPKKQKMVRRLTRANQELQQSTDALTQLRPKFQELMNKVVTVR